MPSLPSKREYRLPTRRVAAMNRRKRRFLNLYAELGSVAKACKAASIKDAGQVYEWRKNDPDFAKAWSELAERLGDVVEGALFDRAVNGVERTIYFKGEPVGVERQYSDAGAMALLRGLKPDRYREAGGAVNVNVGNFGVAIMPATALSEDEWEKQATQLTQMQNRVAAGIIIEGEAERVDESGIKRG